MASLKKWRDKAEGSSNVFSDVNLDGIISPYAAAIEKRKMRFQETEQKMNLLSEENQLSHRKIKKMIRKFERTKDFQR